MSPPTPGAANRRAKPPPQAVDDGQERLARLVRNAARAYTRALQRLLLPHGVTYGHWSLLRALWAQDGMSQNELSVLSDLSVSTTSSAVKSLCALGLVEQRKRPGNNKTVHVFLTPEGRQLMRKLVPLAVQVNEASVRDISAEDVQTTRRVLLTITHTLDEGEAQEQTQRPGRRSPSTQGIRKQLLDVTARRARK